MAFPSCSLWFFSARTDVSFMMYTIPHLVKMSNYPFQERVLAIDTAPLSGEKVNRPGIGSMEQLQECARLLVKEGVIDRIVEFNYNLNYRQRVFLKHFGSPLRCTHNYKGYPILGSIFKIEECKSDYMLHYDSDMMLYQEPGHSWIEESIELMQRHLQMMFVRPLAGPPTSDSTIYKSYSYARHPDGFYQYNFFGSRLYLIDCKRFDRLLPIPVIWRDYESSLLKNFNHLPVSLKTAANVLTGIGKLDSWEIMVSEKLKQTDYYRATLTNPQSWTLHPTSRSPAFMKAWPDIIKKIEAGYYPPQQAGYYDLIPELWLTP